MTEPTLDAVEAEDKPIITDIIGVIETLKLCSTWTVNVVPKGYEIQAWLNAKEDTMITLEDLDLIQQVNRLRVQMAGVKVYPTKACVRVMVISHKEPVMLQEQAIVRIHKRKRWA